MGAQMRQQEGLTISIVVTIISTWQQDLCVVLSDAQKLSEIFQLLMWKNILWIRLLIEREIWNKEEELKMVEILR